MLKEHSHIVHESTEGVPTIQLGCGGVAMADIHGSGIAGVAFMFNEDPVDIGAECTNPVPNGTDGENGAFFRIIATNPKSLQVLIGRLEEAVANFNEP